MVRSGEVETFLRADHGTGIERPPRTYVQVDGTGAPLRHKELEGRVGKGPDGKAQTHEVKIAAIFTEHPRFGEDSWRDSDSTTYVATDERCDPFGAMVRAEYDRRFAGKPETNAIGDGALWIWELFRIRFPWAIQIVDFHHAAEHVAALAELVYKRGTPEWKKLRRKWTKKLWKGKTLVGLRFKGSGMHWSQLGLKRLLAIRTALYFNRYDAFWTWRATKLKPAA